MESVIPNADAKALKAKLDAQVKWDSAFTKAEDVIVANAWLSVGKDVIVRAEQWGDIFFHGVHRLYSNQFSLAGHQSRSFKSIEKPAKLIAKPCNTLASFFARIARVSPRGVNEKYYMSLETAMYNDHKVQCLPDNVRPRLKFQAAIEISHEHPKFIMAFDLDDGKSLKDDDCNTKPQSPCGSHFNQEDDPMDEKEVELMEKRDCSIGRR